MMIRRIFVFDHVSNLVASCILFEKLLRQLPRTNLPCEKTSLQELPASNIALHAVIYSHWQVWLASIYVQAVWGGCKCNGERTNCC